MSLTFDATNEGVIVPDDARCTWTPVTQPRSLHLFYRCNTDISSGETHEFLWTSQTDGNKFVIRYSYDSTLSQILEVMIINSGWDNIGRFYCSFTPTEDVWNSIAFCASTSGNCTIYVNGVSQSVTHVSWDDSTAINPDEYTFNIGNSASIAGSFSLAHWSWWNKVLSQEEVLALKNNLSYPSGSNLLLWYKMDEGTGTNVNDYSGTPLDATMANAAWQSQPVVKGISSANPVILDNDECIDGYIDDYFAALAAKGTINLVGMITSTSINEYVTSGNADTFAAERATGVGYAEDLGWTGIPTPVVGIKGNLSKPGSGLIDDTTGIGSVGTTLIVDQANLASAETPLVVCVGGSLSTVADAYLDDPTIVNKVVVVFLGMSSTNMNGAEYNAWMDGWATNIVLQKFRMIIVSPDDWPDKCSTVTKARITSDLPTSDLKTWMYDKDHPINGLPGDTDPDGPAAKIFMLDNYILTAQTIAYTGLTNATIGSATHEVPTFAYSESGTDLIVLTVDADAATTEFWRAMLAPRWSATGYAHKVGGVSSPASVGGVSSISEVGGV